MGYFSIYVLHYHVFLIKKSQILILDISNSTIIKIYIGQTIHPKLRFQQHKKRLPTCMKQVVAKYINFESFLIFDIVYNSFNKHECDTKKSKMIRNFYILGKYEYNIMTCRPTLDHK